MGTVLPDFHILNMQHCLICYYLKLMKLTFEMMQVGPDWEHVVDKCRRGHFQPLLLLYADPNGTAVATASAPTTVTPVVAKQPVRHYPATTLPTSSNQQRRSVTPNAEQLMDARHHHVMQPRRAVTPNPEASAHTWVNFNIISFISIIQ